MRITNFHIKALSKAKLLMDQHLHKHYTAEDLAQEVGIGASQLKKAFKQHYNAGIYAYQLKKRLHYAAQLIYEDNATLKSIARQAGFKHLSNFTTAFKKEFGLSPGRFRITPR